MWKNEDLVWKRQVEFQDVEGGESAVTTVLGSCEDICIRPRFAREDARSTNRRSPVGYRPAQKNSGGTRDNRRLLRRWEDSRRWKNPVKKMENPVVGAKVASGTGGGDIKTFGTFRDSSLDTFLTL